MNAGEAERVGNEVEDSRWLDHAVRWGLVSYGVVHLLIAWLAVQLALGQRSGNASGKGALAELSQQPFGGVLIWLVTIGMLLLVVWRVLEAFFGHDDEDGADLWKARAVSASKAILYAVLGVSAFKVATGSSGGGDHTDTMTAKLMSLPAGPLIVGAVGVGIIGYGLLLVWRGWSEKFREHLDARGQSGEAGTAYTWFGKVGYIAKGLALGVVGGLFCYAAITHDPDKSGGLDQALREILQRPFGSVMLIAIGVGIGCYGLFCFARARHLDR